MRVKKVVALMLAVIMAASLAACGNAEKEQVEGTVTKEETAVETETEVAEESKEITFPLEETMTFTFFASGYEENGSDLNHNYIWDQATKERANINIEVTSIGEGLDEQRNLVLSSGDYPDAFYRSGMTFDEAAEYGAQGVLIPLEDLMREYAPNFCALMDEQDAWKYITAADGHVYSFPQEAEKFIPFETNMWVNHVWMDNLGITEEPTNMDEFYQLLKAFKEGDANGNGDATDEIPFSASADYGLLGLMAYQDAYSYNWQYRIGVDSDGNLVNSYTDESFKEFLAFAKKLYDEGLVNEDCFVIEDATRNGIGVEKDVFGSFLHGAAFIPCGSRGNDFLMVDFGATKERQVPWSAGAFAITDVCENPEVLVAWVDYFYTEEGATLAWRGVEGINYAWDDNGIWGGIELSDEDLEKYWGTVLNNSNGGSIPCLTQPEKFLFSVDQEKDPMGYYLNVERKESFEKAQNPLYFVLTDEETEVYTDIVVEVEAYQEQYLAQVVTGKLVLEDSWDDYVKTMEGMGVNDLFAIYQAANARN